MKRQQKNKIPNTVPFNDAVEAWFWFIKAQEARNDGARYVSGLSLLPRPCEPSDFLKILDRLYRNRILLRDHLLVLRHYGRRQLPPDTKRVKEAIAYKLWVEAFEKIEPILMEKKIIRNQSLSVFHAIERDNISKFEHKVQR